MDRVLTERERLYASGSRKRDNIPTGNPRGRPKGSSYAPKPEARPMAVFAPEQAAEEERLRILRECGEGRIERVEEGLVIVEYDPERAPVAKWLVRRWFRGRPMYGPYRPGAAQRVG